MDNQLQTVLRQIVRCFNESGVDYSLIGGLAASVRGRIRATEDVDLLVDLDPDAALGLLHPLKAYGFGPLFPEVEQVVRQSYILAIEHVETGITVDLAIGQSDMASVTQRGGQMRGSGSGDQSPRGGHQPPRRERLSGRCV